MPDESMGEPSMPVFTIQVIQSMIRHDTHFALIKMKGDRKVRTWTHHRSGLSADIFLRGTRFVALFLEKQFEAPDVKMIESKMADYAEHWITMEWHPMIEVEIGEPHSRDDPDKQGIELQLDRYYLSRSPTGEMFQCGWDVDVEHRKAGMVSYGSGYRWNRGLDSKLKLIGLPIKAPLKTSDGGWLLDYDERLWRGFKGVQAGIKHLRKRLNELVGTRKGIEQLLKGGDGRTLLLNDAVQGPLHKLSKEPKTIDEHLRDE